MVNYLSDEDPRNDVWDDIFDEINKEVGHLELSHLDPIYQLLVEEDEKMADAIREAAYIADDADSFQKAIEDEIPSGPFAPVGPFWSECHDIGIQVYERVWPKVKDKLGPFSPSERIEVEQEIVRDAQGSLARRLDDRRLITVE